MTTHEGLRIISDNIDAILSVTARIQCTYGTAGNHALANLLEARLSIDKLTYVGNEKDIPEKLTNINSYDRKAILETNEVNEVFERCKWLFSSIGSMYNNLDKLAMTDEFQQMLEDDENEKREKNEFPLGYLLLLNARTKLQMAQSWMDADLMEHYNAG